ncbi:MAG: hypothetical protein DMF61_11565 [Blastocatellia bacterium AA13]|nr:MAG: hypothetical protein DMF61_11565 [Blastocatellia bacterium AA13]
MRIYRNGNLGRVYSAVLAVSLICANAIGQEAAAYKELPNFRKINDQIYGGGQPRTKGLSKLAELGIKTVVNLRGVDNQTRAEEQEAGVLGLRYYSIPMPGLARPSDEQVAKVFALLNDQANWPIFVHCNHGSDRTGTILACYRISHDRWTDDRAISEAKQYGMSWIEFGMRSFVSDYYKKQIGGSENGVKAEAAAPDKPM